MIKQMFTIAAFAACMPVLVSAQDDMANEVQNDFPVVAEAETSIPALMVDPNQDGFVPFKCPIEKIRIAYQNLVDPEDTLMALAIEKQTLAICRQSQEALIRIAENEVRLNELFEPIIAPPPPPPVPEPEPVITPEPVAPVAIGPVPSAVPTAPLAPIAPLVSLDAIEPLVLIDPMDLPDAIVVEEVEAPEPTEPPYALAAVMKDPLGWKAMLVDGDAIFTVREGQKMDDGSIVKSIVRGRVELVTTEDFSFFLE